MGLFNQKKDTVEWIEYRPDLLFYKWKNREIKKGSRLVIRSGQKAIFYSGGRIHGIFENEGTYDIDTQIIPFLTDINAALHLRSDTGERAEVYFVNSKEKHMKTAIVTDTNSGITVEEGRQSGIFVLPMPVIIEEHCYLEGVDITNEDLYQAMTADKNLSSSQPSPGDVMDLWNRVLESGYDEIVHIPMSSGLSGSCQTAKQLALDYDSKVQVVDNHRISVTLMESVYDAKFLADQGKSAVEIRKYLEETAYQASIFLTVNSLKYLKKSGRITSSAAAIANILNIKPLLTIQGEKLDLFAKVRGSRQSEKKLIEALKADIASRFLDVPSDRLQIATAGTFEKEEDAKRWVDLVQSAFPDHPVYHSPLSCSMACHVGINASGLGAIVTAKRK